jgi:hypothetical protein
MRMVVLATVFVIGAAIGYLLRRRVMPYAPGFVQRNAEPIEPAPPDVYVTWADGSVTGTWTFS